MTRLRWTGGQFTDGSRGFRTTGTSEHEFEDDDRVDEYLDHRSGNWERVEDSEDDIDETDADSADDDVQEDGADEDVAEAETEAEDDDEISDDELVELLDGSVGDLEDALATGEYDDPDVLNRLARIEREDGDSRTTAIEAIDARRED